MVNEIDLIIPGRGVSLGDFSVKRVLPYSARRMIGPFVFLDHMGPHLFAKGYGLSVSPHPHIGLSTLTYLMEGRILHRDSLGSEMVIEPGAVNWMTAGRGIAHSERSLEADRRGEHRLNGLQLWVALPDALEDIAPAFTHFTNDELPRLRLGDVTAVLVAGRAGGREAPAQTHSPLFLLDLHLREEERAVFDPDGQELGLYVAHGEVRVGELALTAGQLAVFKPGASAEIRATTETRAFFLGGQGFPNGKQIWWNFVSSSKEKIEIAKRRWEADQFERVVNESAYDRAPLPRA